MYEDGQGTRLTCYYVSVDVAGETESEYREENGVSFIGSTTALLAQSPPTPRASCCSKSPRSLISRTRRTVPNPTPAVARQAQLNVETFDGTRKYR
jgi:hypothetical protein